MSTYLSSTDLSVRSLENLNGLWDFSFLGGVDVHSFVPEGCEACGKMPVPGAFDALPAYAGKRGVAIYRTRFLLPAGKRGRIEFGAVSMWARVYVDGAILGENACGYAPFHVDVPASESAERELVVLVDNRFDFARIPMHGPQFDFYQYGGILRDVTLHVLPGQGAWIDSLQVTPTSNYDEGEVSIAVAIKDEAAAEITCEVQFDRGTPQTFHSIPLVEGVGRLLLSVPKARLWSPQAPHLHRLRVILLDADGTPCDDMEARFGLRRVEARSGALWLNSEKLRLRGYNRHEWHPSTGPCTSSLQMVADLQLLRDLGCNFVRGSHYPQDQRFLDLCDELGFLVWEENLGWGQREDCFASAKFKADHDATLRAMVRTSYNHPSVIIWGFLNEAGTDQDYVRECFEQTTATLRKLDPSRLVTYASMFGAADTCFDLADIVSINLYPGWYGCEGSAQPLEMIAPALQETFDAIDARGFGDKPIILSEIGAEGLYGWHDMHGDFFTEEYQAEYLSRACQAVLSDSRVSGIALWQFCDTRTYGGGRSLNRPRTFNNKGTVDEFRRPKAAYQAVRTLFRAAADKACNP